MDISNLPQTEHHSQPSASGEQESLYQTLSFGEHGLYPQFLLFGDSITQQSSLTLQARLQHLYIRRADILNRGFSGYTTTLALSTLPHFLPPSTPNPSEIQPPIRLSTIFFGANDACLPGNAQHVPLPLYTASLRELAEYHIFKNHGTRIIFITPGPVNEWQLSKPLTRTATNAKLYAEAVRALAEEMDTPCVDLWTAFMRLAGYSPLTSDTSIAADQTDGPTITNSDSSAIDTSLPLQQQGLVVDSRPLPGSLAAPPNEVLSTLLADGLHFTDRAYHILFDELMATIRHEIPQCSPENLPTVFRDWKHILGVLPAPVQVPPSSEPELEHIEDTSTILSETEVDGQVTPESDWLDMQPDTKPGVGDDEVTSIGVTCEARPDTNNEVIVPTGSINENHQSRVEEAAVIAEVTEEAQHQAVTKDEGMTNQGCETRTNGS